MLKRTTAEQLAIRIAEEHPAWSKEYVRTLAERYVSETDERLDEVLEIYCRTGSCTEFCHGEFTLFMIRGIRPGLPYSDVVALMNDYLLDPGRGKRRILWQ